jgi:Uma2 family endonuclease
MSTSPTAAPSPAPPEPDDPYRYGWRYVRRELPDGNIVVEQQPLTLEDVIHPQEGDQVTESQPHERRRRYLADVFEARLSDDPTAVVLSDVRVAWDVPGLRPLGPDIAVILGVRERKNWSTFSVAEEGVRPELIVELTSPETAEADRSTKWEEYELARVPLYVIVDAVRGGRWVAPNLYAYQLGPAGYRAVPLDERGRLWLEPVRCWLGVADGELVAYDEAGQPLGDYRAVTAALAEAQARAAAAESRLRELEAELLRLRGKDGA